MDGHGWRYRELFGWRCRLIYIPVPVHQIEPSCRPLKPLLGMHLTLSQRLIPGE